MTIGYADLGAEIVEVVMRERELLGCAVGVAATGEVRETWGSGGKYTLLGGRLRLLPF